MKKYILYLFLLPLVFFFACEDEEINDAVPDFPPAIGISSESVTDFSTRTREILLTEGDTAIIYIGIFSDRDNDQTVTVDWTATGAVSLNGQVTIEEGTKVDTVLVPIPENTAVNDTTTITFTLSNVNPSLPFVPEEGRESITFEVVDDPKVLALEGGDTLAVTEADGTISVPIAVAGSLDEEVEINYVIEGTAQEGVDYELIASPFTVSGNNPTLDIRLLNNADVQETRTLDVIITGITSDDDEVSLSTDSDTIVYELSDDTKAIGFSRLDIAVPVADDTLLIAGPGTYEVSVGVMGSLLGEATVEVNNTGLPAGINPLVSNPFTLVPDEDARPYSFTVSAQAFDNLTEDIFFSFTLENATALNNDNEVVVSEDAGQILIQLVAPE